MTKPTSLDTSAAAVMARLEAMSALSDLAPAGRMDAKINMSPDAILRRLQEVSALLVLCRAMAETAPRASASGIPGDRG